MNFVLMNTTYFFLYIRVLAKKFYCFSGLKEYSLNDVNTILVYGSKKYK